MLLRQKDLSISDNTPGYFPPNANVKLLSGKAILAPDRQW